MPRPWHRGSDGGGQRTGSPLLVVTSLVLVVVVSLGEAALVVKCSSSPAQQTSAASQQQTTQPPPYCNCTSVAYILSIKCDFQNKEAIKLTRELLEPFLNRSLKSTYVRMKSATSVYVTSQFMQAWHEVPSSALDVWYGGNVTLESSPVAVVPREYTTTTFAGVGIVGCNITEVPAKFLRDRQRGGFRIKNSHVGVIRAGFIHKIREMRYIVMESSVVGTVEGSVASEGYVTLSQREVHSWKGLKITDSSIGVIAAGAFNLTHHSDMESVEVVESRVGRMGSMALTMVGDISVTIKKNLFEKMDRGALKVAVTGTVNFDQNTIRSWAGDALEGFMCHNRTTLESNTFLVDGGVEAVLNQSTTPFHTSCGNPQIFLVITPQTSLRFVVDPTGAWAVGGLLVVVVLVMVVVGWRYFGKGRETIYNTSTGRFTGFLPGRGHNARRTSLENLPKHAELNIPADYQDEDEDDDDDVKMKSSRGRRVEKVVEVEEEEEEEVEEMMVKDKPDQVTTNKSHQEPS